MQIGNKKFCSFARDDDVLFSFGINLLSDVYQTASIIESLEVFRNEILTVCYSGKNLHVEVIRISESKN